MQQIDGVQIVIYEHGNRSVVKLDFFFFVREIEFGLFLYTGIPLCTTEAWWNLFEL